MSVRKIPQRCVFALNGGEVSAVSILMYPEPIVRQWQGIVAAARAELGGSPLGSGLGFIGSPGWALGGAALLTILGTASANAKAKKAVALFSDAEQMRTQMIDEGSLLPLASISNIELPDPSAWVGKRASHAEVDMKTVPLLSRSSFLREHGLSKQDVRDGKVAVPATDRFVLFDNEFVTVWTGDEEVAVRWPSVASYKIAN
jgi:hypothetical protein